MAESPLQDWNHAAQAAWQEAQASLAEGRQRVQDQKQKSDTCQQVITMLKGLPDRPSHDIMVPLGKAAFLPARLTDTERCHVTLGEHSRILAKLYPVCVGARFVLPLATVCIMAWHVFSIYAGVHSDVLYSCRA